MKNTFRNSIYICILGCYTIFSLTAYSEENSYAPIPAALTKKFFFPPADYPVSPYVPPEVWNQLTPYFLPKNHPLRSKLDSLFSTSRVVLNTDTFKAAGFDKHEQRTWSRAIISQHRALPGIFVKAFPDTELGVVDWEKWLQRIRGAQAVKACIAKHGYEKYFKAPVKWIYPLPSEPSPPFSPHYSRKNFILIAEDMHIVKKKENAQLYKMKMNPEMLDALYIVLQEEGLNDSIIPSNIPFAKDGRLAFIDTERYHNWPVYYDRLTPSLSPPMQHYWKTLIQEGGPAPKNTAAVKNLIMQPMASLSLINKKNKFTISHRSGNHRYEYNPYVPLPVWDTVKPFFLPDNHPLRSTVDSLFNATRVTQSDDNLKKAGFSFKARKLDKITGCIHSKAPGLFFKVYFDTQLVTDDWNRWLKRINGADAVRACIEKYGYQDICAVPFKWIYPLPMDPSPPDNAGYVRKNFILVTEDMRILPRNKNAEAYRYNLTKRHLNALYTILTEVGLSDSHFIFNIPFNEDGKITFIDTEHYHEWPVHYEMLVHRFSDEMRAYWEDLIINGGPK